MRYIVSGIVFVAALLLGAKSFAAETTHINLEAKNTAALREEFTASSVNTLKNNLITLDQTLAPNEEINLYLSSPGGEIIAGKGLIETIHGLRHKVNVIADFAASMAYLTTQGTTGKRYVTMGGVLMSHRAYGGAEGYIPGNFETRTEFWVKFVRDLSQMAANRTGVSLKDYETKVREEYWVVGQDAVKDKQADAVVTVSCSSDLNGTTTEVLYTVFGPVGIVWANCPLITEPMAIDFSQITFGIGEENREREFENTITQALMHKRELVNDSVLETNYLNYVK